MNQYSSRFFFRNSLTLRVSSLCVVHFVDWASLKVAQGPLGHANSLFLFPVPLISTLPHRSHPCIPPLVWQLSLATFTTPLSILFPSPFLLLLTLHSQLSILFCVQHSTQVIALHTRALFTHISLFHFHYSLIPSWSQSNDRSTFANACIL